MAHIANRFPIIVARKTADSTHTSTITLSNDPHLSFTVGANETWIFNGVLYTTGDPAGDVRVNLAAPSGATYKWAMHGAQPAVTSSGASQMSAFISDST